MLYHIVDVLLLSIEQNDAKGTKYVCTYSYPQRKDQNVVEEDEVQITEVTSMVQIEEAKGPAPTNQVQPKVESKIKPEVQPKQEQLSGHLDVVQEVGPKDEDSAAMKIEIPALVAKKFSSQDF